jgi:hypothetical protein
MKSIFLSVFLVVPFLSSADSIVESVQQIKSMKSVPVELLAFVSNAKEEDHVGYGLCMAANRISCDTNGSVGYGLCMAGDRTFCATNGSIGYGLCMAAGRLNCETTGSTGYGLCMASDRTFCSL